MTGMLIMIAALFSADAYLCVIVYHALRKG
jgi:hypothetical protein